MIGTVDSITGGLRQSKSPDSVCRSIRYTRSDNSMETKSIYERLSTGSGGRIALVTVFRADLQREMFMLPKWRMLHPIS